MADEKQKYIFYKIRHQLVPINDIKRMRGFLKGIDTEIKRDQDRS